MNSGALDRVLKINISFFIYTNPSEEEEEEEEEEKAALRLKSGRQRQLWAFSSKILFQGKVEKKAILLGTTHIPSFFLLQVEVALFVHVVRVRAHTIQRWCTTAATLNFFFSFESGKKTKTFIWRKKEERRQKLRSFLDFYVMRLVFFYCWGARALLKLTFVPFLPRVSKTFNKYSQKIESYFKNLKKTTFFWKNRRMHF